MVDKGVTIELSRTKHKKYAAILPSGRRVNFGDKRYEQFKDATPLKAYQHKKPTTENRNPTPKEGLGQVAGYDRGGEEENKEVEDMVEEVNRPPQTQFHYRIHGAMKLTH